MRPDGVGAVATGTEEPAMPKFTTVRFGDLDYRQDDVIHLPEARAALQRMRMRASADG